MVEDLKTKGGVAAGRDALASFGNQGGRASSFAGGQFDDILKN